MKSFKNIKFDAAVCKRELAEFRDLLEDNEWLSERKQILPFFKDHEHLSSLIGTYNPSLVTHNLVAFEYPVSGDFTCDLAVGDSKRQAYCFVEFENAERDSVFREVGRHTPEWSSRFEHGYSQIIDWFYALQDMAQTGSFRHKFGSNAVDYTGVLVVGRSERLAQRETERLRWRLNMVVVNSKRVHCITFDELYSDMYFRLHHDDAPRLAPRWPGAA